MTCCCQTEAFDHFFDHKTASGIIKKFHKKGPDKTTKILTDALKKEFIDGYSLLDIGGGIGAIQLELFKYGLDFATNIDASLPFINVSKQEVRKQGYADKVKYYHNNFVDVAEDIKHSDIVTLDKVICCFHDVEKLIELSSSKAKKYYGLVFPRDFMLARIGIHFINFMLWLWGKNIRGYIHRTSRVDNLVIKNGFKRCFYHKTLFWQVIVYDRL